MLKSLPAIEKEFNMEEVDKANPDWVKFIMLGFVAIILISSLFI